jgi:gamma-glutamylcysteine synthetase
MKWNDARAELQDSTKTSNMMRTDSSMATCSYTLTQARLLRREKQRKGEIESAAHQEIAAAVVQVEGDGAARRSEAHGDSKDSELPRRISDRKGP